MTARRVTRGALDEVRALPPERREALLLWMAECLPGPVRVGIRHLPPAPTGQIPAETAGHPVPEMIQ